ncbi:MAG: hypothetical protein ACE361_06245 [Aureliella sp.]
MNHHEELDEREANELESLIFAAKNYVVTSEDLRPHLVERASDRERTRRLAKRCGLLSLACMLVWSVSLPVYRGITSLRESIKAPTSQQLEARAAKIAEQSKRNSDWSMVDAFQESRTITLHAAP